MRRDLLLLSCLPLALAACGDSSSTDETTASSSEGSISITGTLGETTMGPAGSDATDSDSGPSDTDTGAVPCTSKDDCVENEKCNEQGFCEFDPTVCGEDQVEMPVLTPPNVVLVLDKSGSMVNPENNWDHDADANTPDVTRWAGLHQVVVLVGNKFNNTMNLGAQLFPSTQAVAVLGPQACVVNDTPEVPVGKMNGPAVIAGIPPEGATDLAGGTPAEKGMSSAVNHLMTAANPDPNLPEPDPYIILVTDGAANCSTSAPDDMALLDYDQNLVPTIADAFAMGIPTYVVGVDIKDEVDGNGINPFEVLNDAANAGGKPKDDPVEKFYNTINKIELEEALDKILGDVLSCTIPLPDGVPPMTKPAVVVNGVEYPEPLPPEADCETEDGWRFTNEEMTEIELCGKACSDYQLLGSLDVVFKCQNQG